jgi:septation ring formation regulator EzrA
MLYSELYGIALVIFIVMMFAGGIFVIKKIDNYIKKLEKEIEEMNHEP